MKRMGDIINADERVRVGDHRYIRAAENLATKVLFLDVVRTPQHYVHRRPYMDPSQIPGLPSDVKFLGEYEAMLLGKLLHPVYPVLCIEGPAGSGKSTTLAYLLDLVRRLQSASANGRTPAELLIARLDFRQQGHGEFGPGQIDAPDSRRAVDELIKDICRELSARSREHIQPAEEFDSFWNGLIAKYARHEDPDIGPVVRRILDEDPRLHRNSTAAPLTPAQLEHRRGLMDAIRAQDTRWYLRYLILFWRYWIESRHDGRRDKAFVVLDNLDSLSPHLQRLVLDLIMRAAHQDGPTFVIALRPETRMRQGLADTLIDVITQEGPRPFDVIADRLRRFTDQPQHYADPTLGLTRDQYQLITDFITRVYTQITSNDTRFADFSAAAAGRSIRLGLLLAQGLFLTSIADMTSSDTTQHFLVRSCVRQGQPQFRASVRSPIENVYNISGITETARLLLKPRLLRYMEQHDNRCALSVLRSTFVLFGYEEDWIKRALNDLLRHECQMIRSDGYDVFRENWGDEQEMLYLTEKGKAYVRYLMHDTDYIQEVMLDCQVDEARWPNQVAYGHLSDKLKLLRLFLRDLAKADVGEVESFVRRLRVAKYHELFGTRLISLDTVQRVYRSVGRIITTSAHRHPHQKTTYRSILDDYTSLVRQMENENKRLLGAEPEPTEEFTLEVT